MPTHCAFDGQALRQVVEVNDQTAFPVTADPSFWWYLEKGSQCVVSLGAYALGGAKAVQAAYKIGKILRASKPGTALYRAYAAWRNLGSSDVQRLNNFAWSVARRGYSAAVREIRDKGGRATAAYLFIMGSAAVVTDILGVSSCISLVRGI